MSELPKRATDRKTVRREFDKWSRRHRYADRENAWRGWEAAAEHYGRAPLPADQTSNPAPRKREILAICDAYESGIGHGLQRDGHSSGAIWSDPECGQAYELGYAEGFERSGPEARIVGQQTKGGGNVG